MLVLLQMTISCKNRTYENFSDHTLDTISVDGVFFADETLLIKANDSLLLKFQLDSKKRFQNVYRQFIIRKKDTVQLSIQTFFEGRKIIDTSFTIPPKIYIESIGVSICYPLHISVDSLKKISEPHFGYIPIDSCKRYFSLIADSAIHRYPIY